MSHLALVTFKWPHGGTEVLLVGTFTKWQEGAVKMKREEKDGPFVTRVRLSPGTYQFKFIVDGNWNFDHSQFYVMDGSGNTNNELTVHTGAMVQSSLLLQSALARIPGHIDWSRRSHPCNLEIWRLPDFLFLNR